MIPYSGFNFSDYLTRYIERKGISKAAISKILGLSYETVRSKFKKNTFTSSEVLYLDIYYPDLKYVENYRRYIELTQKYHSEHQENE